MNILDVQKVSIQHKTKNFLTFTFIYKKYLKLCTLNCKLLPKRKQQPQTRAANLDKNNHVATLCMSQTWQLLICCMKTF